jgi:hypothetical protein
MICLASDAVVFLGINLRTITLPREGKGEDKVLEYPTGFLFCCSIA